MQLKSASMLGNNAASSNVIPVVGQCGVCQKASQLRCSNCFNVFYCDSAHQKAHWKSHKTSCKKPYVIDQNETYGRFMVASRDLKAGDLILKEAAAVAGPHLDTFGGSGLCLACHDSKSSNFHFCHKCKGPLCSNCVCQGRGHQECDVLKQWPMGMYTKFQSGTWLNSPSVSQANYHLIAPIRFLLLRRSDVKKYKKVIALQSHVEERREMGKTSIVMDNFVKLLTRYKLSDVTEDLIQDICGIFDTNAFDISGIGNLSLSGLFPEAAMMMHSCYKNTRITFSEKCPGEYVMSVYARCDIRKGDPIYHSYCRPLTSTNMRRFMLFTGKHFACQCRRCRDPQELGSFCSALLCPQCQGVVVPRDPLDLETRWQCLACGLDAYGGQEVASMERSITVEWESICKAADIKSLETFLTSYKSKLHANHAFIVGAQQLLVILRRQRLKNLQEIEEQVQLCRHVLHVISIIENGIATQIGTCKYELAQALICLHDRLKIEKPEEHVSQCKSLTMEIRGNLQDAIEILLPFEAPHNHLWLLGRNAEADLSQFNQRSKHCDESTASFI